MKTILHVVETEASIARTQFEIDVADPDLDEAEKILAKYRLVGVKERSVDRDNEKDSKPNRRASSRSNRESGQSTGPQV